MRRVRAIAAVLVLGVAGCGGGSPQIDATDSSSLDASVNAMTEKMSAPEREQLAADALIVAKPQGVRTAFHDTFTKGSTAPGRSLAFRPLQGMTAAEIHAKAEEIRAGAGSPKAK